ncbi:MAG: hypothetical protein JNL32_00700 [Candidatus Kapabacteria bacterium]|nr:hypothetical protein [Candidatus Kapabacteria bacterium]
MIGYTLESVINEQYFYCGKLDSESLGTLKIKFSNGHEFIFDCDGDGESLKIQKGSFHGKGILESDFEKKQYRWKENQFLSNQVLKKLGKTIYIYVELLTNHYGTYQSGCKIEFESGDYLYIWTILSDNIFYMLNGTPPYHKKEGLTFKLTDVKTIHNSINK